MYFNNKPNRVLFNSFFALLSCILLLISSCTVRNALSDIIDVEIGKPLSPAKAGTQDISSCNYIDRSQTDIKSHLVRNHRPFYNLSVDFLPVNERVVINNTSLDFHYISKIPKYLLFKKIKYFIS